MWVFVCGICFVLIFGFHGSIFRMLLKGKSRKKLVVDDDKENSGDLNGKLLGRCLVRASHFC